MTDSWPHTGRWLPWLIAAFLTVAWLLPIDSITPHGFSAFDLKFDRVMLAGMGLVWVASVCAGGPDAPRLRHNGPVLVAVVFLGLISMFSVLVNLQILILAGDNDEATKKLFLLGAYVAFFVIVATSLRPDEIRRMGRLFMWLGVIAAVGIIYDRFRHSNPFFWLAGHILPGSEFSLRPIDVSIFDPHPVTGPSRHGLGAAGMLAMAVPFALLEAIYSRGWRRVLHALAFAVLMTGVWATNRKTGVFAATGALAFLTLVQPRTMVGRVLPLLGLGLIVVAAFKPHGVAFELERLSPSKITKGASSQGRTIDYAAIVPDILQHPTIGRGYGSYNPDKYRVLDNNYLVMLIETGILGLAAFAAMIASVWMCARRVARMNPARAGPALAAAAAAIAFAVSMALFDATAFPQVPYFFFLMGGFVCVLWRETQPDTVPAVALTAPA